MRAVKLAKVAAQAERLRVQAMARRQVRRGAYGFAGIVFAVGALCLGHVVVWLVLAPTVGSLLTLALTESLRVWFGTNFIGAANTIYGVLLILFIIFMPRGILGLAETLRHSRREAITPAE